MYKLDKIKSFGKVVSRIRKNQNMSQSKLAELSRLSEKTISGIENDRISIQTEYLELLSSVLNTDLFKLYMENRFDDYPVFLEIANSINKNINDKNTDGLKKDESNLSKLKPYINNTYYKTYSEQLLMLVQSLIYRLNKNYTESIITSMDAIKITIPRFSIKNDKVEMLTNLEMRLLTNIAFSYYYQNKTKQYSELIEYIFERADETDQYYIKVCYNIANMHSRSKNYNMAIDYYNKALEIILSKLSFEVLPLCYYGLAYCKYLMSDDTFINYLIKSLFYSYELELYNLRTLIFEKAKKFMNLDSEYLIMLENESNNSLRKQCINCSHYNIQVAKFCNNCGEKL